MPGEMKIDEAFVEAVMLTIVPINGARDIIEATLAVAAERGMIVPEDARKLWAVKSLAGDIYFDTIKADYGVVHRGRSIGETVVRVAVVEVPE